MISTPETPEKPASGWDSGGWLRTIALGMLLAVIYLANGREIGTYDTIPTTLTALNVARGQGIDLDRFRHLLREPDGRPAPYVERTQGRLISRYPIAPALIAAPLHLPQMPYYDAKYPGWTLRPESQWAVSTLLGKNSAAILAALAGMAIYQLLRRIGLTRVALPATIAATLGTDLWAVGSQSLWQHGPAALLLALTMLWLGVERPSKGRLLLAGITASIMVACRSIDVVFALIALGWILGTQPRRLGWFLPGPVLIGAALLGFNGHYFGALSGGQAALEAMHPELHGVEGVWGNPLLGAAGTLVSPARGLLVFSPWVILAVVLAPWSFGRLRAAGVVPWMVALGLIASLALLSSYSVWWAGHTFGPRYWTDAAPLLAVLLAAGLDWCRTHARWLNGLFALTIALAVGIQAVGAFCYPSSWNLSPTNIDRDHARLWDWKDTELRRAVIECLEADGR